ncbi:MlaD family protein [Ohtaekwangia koreensis]|uniref:Phospholipid/cholesterol/gamma-HCH transport system substrate-binding protein n=1 Tax=Ohtaekwangia koreensis TaxID=688867 RepID=A0A1T5M601_9BACT|nr:MlaD family protein [Ohtaekwangia koreensis]SKC83553.1 phospholipid/cholesterol/gamma-HCH transport system substrate-binding protein [Ohtaekwangia koreensis]
MKNKTVDNAKVGLFVVAGIIFLVFTLYMIGKNRNLLGTTFIIKAIVSNVNGLVPGNNVRFKGIDVGTVKSVSVENDTAIVVTMLIDEKLKSFIKKNAIASIGTDGLMGNKLININSQPGHAEPVHEGDIIFSRKAVETDEMLRTLNTTNDNIARISTNLYEITEKLNRSESLWTLLSDTVITQDLRLAVHDFRIAGKSTASFTRNANGIVEKFQSGDGLINRLFMDTTLAGQLNSSLQQIQDASVKTSEMMKDLRHVVEDMKEGEGTAGLILSDTLLREKLFKSASNIEQGTERFNENMEALKHNFLFRSYFKKKEKQQRDSTQANKN